MVSRDKCVNSVAKESGPFERLENRIGAVTEQLDKFRVQFIEFTEGIVGPKDEGNKPEVPHNEPTGFYERVSDRLHTLELIIDVLAHHLGRLM